MLTIQIRLSGARLGLVEAEGTDVVPTSAELLREMDEFCSQLRDKRTLESISELPAVVAVRGMFRRWGVDPSKYRPSSEALMRRVIQGKGLYSISNIVDLANLGSIETGWPYGLYNRAKISPPVSFRHGTTEEKYEGIGRRVWHLARRPVLADAQGPFGSPISDSTRTQIAAGVTELFTVIFAPAGTLDAAMQAAMEKQARRLTQYADARHANYSIIG